MKAKLSLYVYAMLLMTVLGLAAGCSRTRNDAQVAGDVQGKIYSDGNIQSRQITVQASNGIVTLSGTANSDAERIAAATDAGQVSGVKTVLNNLTVSAPATQAAASNDQQPEEAAVPATRPARAVARSSAPKPRRVPTSYNGNSSSSYSGGSTSATPSAPAPRPVTVPSGTTISVRLIDAIDSEKSQTGQTFRATLDSALVDEAGNTVIPAGYEVTGRLVDVKSAGRFAGKSDVVLELSRLSVNGRSYDLHTSQFTKEGTARGKSTAMKVGGGAALGALIGGLAGGGKGAAIGAGVGAGAGTGVSAATKGQQIVLPSETVLNFQLQSPLSVIATTQGPNAGRQKVE